MFDGGPVFLFGLVAVATLFYSFVVLLAYLDRAPDWEIKRGKLLGMLFVALLLGAFNYKVFYLDEGIAFAAFEGDTARVRFLLRLGADPNAAFEGKTALEMATEQKHWKVVRILQDAGALR